MSEYFRIREINGLFFRHWTFTDHLKDQEMELFSHCMRVSFFQLLAIFILKSSQICRSDEIQSASVVAFGSCNRQNKPQDHWDVIRATNPDLFLWTGVLNIYYAHVLLSSENLSIELTRNIMISRLQH